MQTWPDLWIEFLSGCGPLGDVDAHAREAERGDEPRAARRDEPVDVVALGAGRGERHEPVRDPDVRPLHSRTPCRSHGLAMPWGRSAVQTVGLLAQDMVVDLTGSGVLYGIERNMA